MLKVINLGVKFDQKLILEHINLEINEGDRVAIIGKNGAGKTTFVETIMGLNPIYEGSVEISNNLKHGIKSVFQDVNFDQELTLKQLYYFYSRISNFKPNFKCFEKYEIAHVMNTIYKKVSGGEKQKFKLLLCLEFRPRVLILDEITTSLDYQWRLQIANIIGQYFLDHPQSIIILISHDPNEIKKLCNRYFLLKDRDLTPILDIDKFFEPQLEMQRNINLNERFNNGNN